MTNFTYYSHKLLCFLGFHSWTRSGNIQAFLFNATLEVHHCTFCAAQRRSLWRF